MSRVQVTVVVPGGLKRRARLCVCAGAGLHLLGASYGAAEEVLTSTATCTPLRRSSELHHLQKLIQLLVCTQFYHYLEEQGILSSPVLQNTQRNTGSSHIDTGCGYRNVGYWFYLTDPTSLCECFPSLLLPFLKVSVHGDACCDAPLPSCPRDMLAASCAKEQGQPSPHTIYCSILGIPGPQEGVLNSILTYPSALFID